MNNNTNAYSLKFNKNFSNANINELFSVYDYTQNAGKSEKFNGPSFVDDIRKDLSNSETVSYKRENVSVSQEGLVLKATKEENGFSGAHIKLENQKFCNGYLEIKAKLPKAMAGITPKATLTGEKENCFYSIDFLQVLGLKGKNECGMKASFLNCGEYRPINFIFSNNNTWPTLYPPFDNKEILSEGWHTFGVEITNEFATFYVDRNEYCKIDLANPVFAFFAGEYQLEFSLNAGLRETEAINSDTVFPCEMTVEYVKFYERG